MKTFYLFSILAIFLFLLSMNPVNAQEKPSVIEIGHAISEDNKTVRFIAAYAENSTGIVKLIPNADCKISFGDSQSKMNYNPDSSYDLTKVFTESVKLTYTISCSQQNYTQQAKSKIVDVVTDFFEVVLISPQNTVSTREVNFICEVRGNRPKSINLYSDTSGEWKLRAKTEIRTSKSPFRVNFTEDFVSDGKYNWNCEAESQNSETKLAPANKQFTVKFAPKSSNCFEAADCSSWSPETCSDSMQTRKCNNTLECGYSQSRVCSAISGRTANDSGITLLESPVLLPDKQASPAKSDGLGILPIFLIIIILAGAGAFLFLKFKKKKKAKVDEDTFPDLDNEDLPEEEPEERQDPGEEEGK